MPRETVNFVAEGNIEIRGQKINCFLRDQSQSDLLYNLKCEAANSLNLAVSRRSTSAGNSALLPSDGEGVGGGGGVVRAVTKKIFPPFGPQFGIKVRRRAPRAPSWIRHCLRSFHLPCFFFVAP